MGEAATSGANSNYKNTITLMKRLVGLPFDDPRAQKEMKRVNFKCVPIKHSGGGVDTVGVEVGLGTVSYLADVRLTIVIAVVERLAFVDNVCVDRQLSRHLIQEHARKSLLQFTHEE